MQMHALPECVVGRQPPGNRFRVGERRSPAGGTPPFPSPSPPPFLPGGNGLVCGLGFFFFLSSARGGATKYPPPRRRLGLWVVCAGQPLPLWRLIFYPPRRNAAPA